MDCQIIELSQYRNRKAQQRTKEDRRFRKALSQLNLMGALIDVYHQQMLTLSQNPKIQKLCAEKSIRSHQQIEQDVQRLYQLRDAIHQSLVKKNARNLFEATQLTRYWASPEILETLDVLLSSDYEGFRRLANLLVPQVNEEHAQYS